MSPEKAPLTLALAALAIVVAVFVAIKHGSRIDCKSARPRLWLDRYDLFGGWQKMCVFETRGFFYVTTREGRWWLVDPLGCAFLSKGVNHVSPYGDYAPSLGYSPYERNVKARYGSFDAWIEATAARLRSWGFNTVGSWSYEKLFTRMPYTLFLGVMASYGFNWVTGEVPDIFDPSFEKHADRLAAEKCSSRAADPLLIGYFLDNELRWGPDWRSPRHLLDDFMKLSPERPGKRAAVDALLDAFNGDLEDLCRLLGLESCSLDELLGYRDQLPEGGRFDEARRIFLKRFAERYFSVAVSAVKRHDPNHLVLGVRFAGLPPREVLEVAAKYVDVISVNFYTWRPHEPPVEQLKLVYEATGRPIIVTEFSYKAMDSGLPNTKGAGEPVQTQRERAYLAARYALRVIELPFVVGYHWFQYMDQPREGRFDGENSNFGLVKIDDEPWRLLTNVFTLVNTAAEEVHAGEAGVDELLDRVSETIRES